MGDNRRTVNTSPTPHRHFWSVGDRKRVWNTVMLIIVMIWAPVCDNMYRYGRHLGSFYHNATILETVSIAWVNSKRRIFFIEIQRHEIILSPMCRCYCKMWKSNVKSIVISHVGLPALSQTTCFSDEFPWSVIAQSLTMSAHCRQSPERQNIIDRTHTWQQCSVTISGDISTTKYGFNLR